MCGGDVSGAGILDNPPWKIRTMKTRTILTLALTFALASACGEGPERDENMEEEAAGAADTMERGETAEAGLIELPSALMARAKVTVEAAAAMALAQVPGGEVVAGELEEEDGMLIYSFDIRVDGREGIEEVHVDALSGEVVAQEHEGAEADGEVRDEGNP